MINTTQAVKILVPLIALLVASTPPKATAQAPDGGPEYREIIDQNFPQSGTAIYFGNEPVIILNPRLIPNMDAFRFMRAHEYGHHRLHHVSPLNISPPPHIYLSAELQADCWAARVLSEAEDDSALNAIIVWYRQIGRWQQADQIEECRF